MVADAVLHVAGVQVLSDLQRVLLILLQLPDLLRIQSDPVTVLLVGGRGFGPEPPQNPVGPGRFTLLTAGQVVTGDERTESRKAGFS